ncbi:hypothetical protein BKA93DRAFT_54300 [Sparassis latifolia]
MSMFTSMPTNTMPISTRRTSSITTIRRTFPGMRTKLSTLRSTLSRTLLPSTLSFPLRTSCASLLRTGQRAATQASGLGILKSANLLRTGHRAATRGSGLGISKSASLLHTGHRAATRASGLGMLKSASLPRTGQRAATRASGLGILKSASLPRTGQRAATRASGLGILKSASLPRTGQRAAMRASGLGISKSASSRIATGTMTSSLAARTLMSWTDVLGFASPCSQLTAVANAWIYREVYFCISSCTMS